jgi:putative MATE family efflux protein
MPPPNSIHSKNASQSPAPGPTQMIWSLAWPQILMMFFHFWIGFFDVYVAGLVGDEVQASLGLITQTLFFFLIVAMALANGAVSSISQSLGAGKTRRAMRYVSLCLVLVFAASFLLVVLCFWLRTPLLLLLQVPVAIRPIADYFLLVYLLLLPFYYLFIMGNAVFRAQKQVHIPLLAMIIVTVLNTAGDFGLCFGLWGLPEMGFRGLAWATFISVLCGCVFDLAILYKRGWLDLSLFPPWRWVRLGLPYLWKVAWPSGLMQVLWHSAYLVLFAIAASLPAGNITALAALTAGLRIESILFLPAIAFNMTASILVGHYLGYGDFPGAKRIGVRTWMIGVGLISLCGALLWVYVEPIAGILTAKPDVKQEIVSYMHFNILAIPFTGTSLIIGGVFIGAGATRYNMEAIGGCIWLIRLPLAYLLGHVVLGQAVGIWAAMLVSQFIQALVMLGLFALKDWSRFSMMAHKRNKKPGGESHATHLSTPVSEKSVRI